MYYKILTTSASYACNVSNSRGPPRVAKLKQPNQWLTLGHILVDNTSPAPSHRVDDADQFV